MDGPSTTLALFQARCLLTLAPALSMPSTPSTAEQSSLADHPTAPGKKDRQVSEEPAVVGMLPCLRLAGSGAVSGTLDKLTSGGVSLAAAHVRDGASLVLEWAAPPASGKAVVRFQVVTGEMTSPHRNWHCQRQLPPPPVAVAVCTCRWMYHWSPLAHGNEIALVRETTAHK